MCDAPPGGPGPGVADGRTPQSHTLECGESSSGSLSQLIFHWFIFKTRVQSNKSDFIQSQQRINTEDSTDVKSKCGPQRPPPWSDSDTLFQLNVEDPCIICHDDMSPDSMFVLECRHSFHEEVSEPAAGVQVQVCLRAGSQRLLFVFSASGRGWRRRGPVPPAETTPCYPKTSPCCPAGGARPCDVFSPPLPPQFCFYLIFLITRSIKI